MHNSYSLFCKSFRILGTLFYKILWYSSTTCIRIVRNDYIILSIQILKWVQAFKWKIYGVQIHCWVSASCQDSVCDWWSILTTFISLFSKSFVNPALQVKIDIWFELHFTTLGLNFSRKMSKGRFTGRAARIRCGAARPSGFKQQDHIKQNCVLASYKLKCTS